MEWNGYGMDMGGEGDGSGVFEGSSATPASAASASAFALASGSPDRTALRVVAMKLSYVISQNKIILISYIL